MVVLHVGAGKCGSSALQRFLSSNPEFKLNDGKHIYYHVLTQKGVFSGFSIKDKAEKSIYGYWSSQNVNILSEVDYSSFFANLSEGDIHVFSAEGWINEVNHEVMKIFLNQFNQPVTILMYVRPQVPLMNSAYWQWGAWTDIDSKEWIMNRAKNAAKWYTKYEAFNKLENVKECKVRILSGDIVTDFISLFGKADIEINNQNTTSNKSLPGELLRIMQRNRHLRPGVHASSIDFLLEKYFSGIGGSTPWVIDEELMSCIIKECYEDNKKLLTVLDSEQVELMKNDGRWWNNFSVPFEIESTYPAQAKDPINEALLVRAIEVLMDKDQFLNYKVKNTMKKVIIYANCQSAAIGKVLNENKEFSENFSWVIIPPVQNIKSTEEIEYLVKSVKEADVFIYQHVNSPNFPNETKSEYLLKCLKKDTIKISFPSIYYNGYFPHLKSMMGIKGPLNLVHDYIIAYCFIKGLSEEEVLKLINKPDFYPREISEKYHLASIKTLAQKEIENNVDIKLSDFIKTNYKKEKLLDQFNHPKRIVFNFLAKEILKKLDINDTNFSSSNEYLNSVSAPLYPSTINNLELDFTEDSMLYSNASGLLSQEEVIVEFFKLYKNIDREKILSSITENKPFVIDLVESHFKEKENK